MNQTFRVDHSLLPEDEFQRDIYLQSYFCELIPTSRQVSGQWEICVQRPPSLDFYVDPRLAEGIDWWSRKISHTDISQIPLQYQRRDGFQLSFSDAWTIFSWSEILSQHAGQISGEITVLHVDYHRDLMSPRLVRSKSKFFDILTGLEFDLMKPHTVSDAVRSGAIGMGSFIVPLLHLDHAITIRHLHPLDNVDEATFDLIPTILKDELLAVGAQRPAVMLKPSTGAAKSDSKQYLMTRHLKNWLADIPKGTVLLHLDMDFFNNRFDGDSDRVNSNYKLEKPLTQVIAQIDEIFSALESTGVAPRLSDCSVSLSPGFFPAELWDASISRIEDHVQQLIQHGQWK